MLAYNIRIAANSLRRNPVLTAIIIGGIALGICASTTFTTVRHMFARDPMPGKTDRIFYVRMDNWDPHTPYPTGGGNSAAKAIPTQVSFRDATALMRGSNLPLRQSMAFQGTFTVYPDPKMARPYSETVRICTSDFFPMFNVPFQWGGGWGRRADVTPEQVIVIDDATNQKLFGGGNSVGKRVRLDDREFTVIGVLKPWRPFIRYYDVVGNFVAPPEAIYVPMSLTRPMMIRTTGNSDGWKPIPPPADNPTPEQLFNAFIESDIDFVQFWVELRSPRDRELYQRFVDSYVQEEKKHGRFERPLHNELTPMMELMREFGVVRPEITAMAAISILFLGICALNLTGLLLSKFLARAPEVSVRRALGASRGHVFLQHIVECELVGLAGGSIGMLLAMGVMRFIGKLITTTSVIGLDAEMIFAAV